MNRLPRITVNDVPEDLKKAYQKWCVDQGISMSVPLRYFIETVVIRQGSWDDIMKRLSGIPLATNQEPTDG